MVTLPTYATPAVWQPDVEGNATGKKLAGPCVLSSVKLISGGSAGYVALYNGSSAGDVGAGNLKWILDSSTTYDDGDKFANPLNFDKGIYAVMEQGAGFNCKLCFATLK